MPSMTHKRSNSCCQYLGHPWERTELHMDGIHHQVKINPVPAGEGRAGGRSQALGLEHLPSLGTPD